MPRDWTKQKRTTFCEGALDLSNHANACPIHRADLDSCVAHKRTIGAFATFAFLWLPVHGAICWLCSQSIGLATAAVLLIVAAIFVIAITRWLGLDDLLQKLPLLVILAAIFLGLGFLTSGPNLSRLSGPEYFGTILIVITGLSLLGGLYRPMSAAYQTATMRIPFRDLCVTGGALLSSLAIAATAININSVALGFLASAMIGAYGAHMDPPAGPK